MFQIPICGHWFSEKHINRTTLIIISAGMLIALFLELALRHKPTVAMTLMVAIVVSALPILIRTTRELLKLNFSVDILAVLSIFTALMLREFWVAAIIILMLAGGRSLEDFATRRASSVLSALAKRMPQVAHRLSSDDSLTDIPTASIEVGDRMLLYPHELCPVDGIILQGSGGMDESYLTGEPFLMAKAPGANVLSGAINGDSALTIRATRLASDSRYAKIVEVLHASEQNKPKIRRLGDRIGIWYTPLALAIAFASWFFSGQPDRFLAVLVIATPCPLLIAIPVAIIGAISIGARFGIIIKDPSILEKLESCKTLVVDKTGTLTYGRPTVSELVPLGHWSEAQLLQFAASLERYSKHPLASAVMKSAEEQKLSLLNAENISESPGRGLIGRIAGHSVMLTGRGKLPIDSSLEFFAVKPGLECVVLIDGKIAGLLRFQDQPRDESKPFLRHLRFRHQIEKIVLLSGDRPAEVSHFAARMGIKDVYGGKSPEEKVAIVRELTAQAPTLYIGDGINDAPAMLNATAGIALGVNSDITAEAAGAVILQSSLTSVDELIHIGGRMRRIALQSAGGGMLLSLAGMGAAAAGFLTPIQGAIVQEAIDLLAILNSLRMVMPTGPLSDFHPAPLIAGANSSQPASSKLSAIVGSAVTIHE